jgi:hypothetical protein
MYSNRIASLLALGVAVAGPLAAQGAPRTLPAPNATFEEPFSSLGVGRVRELSDGRLIVADARDKVVQRIDLRTGQAVAIGREGSGPAEFGMPLRVFGAPSDTTLLFDPLNTRYLVIGPDAKPLNTFRTESESPASAGGPGGGRVTFGGGLMARASDSRGRLYGEGSPLSIDAEGRPKSADSAAIVRYDRGARRLDTLAFVKLPAMNVQMSGGANNQRIMIGGSNPLTPRDEWTVFPDGRVAIVRAGDYHVDWIMPNGTKRSTPAVRYTPVRMTAAEIRHEEQQRNVARAGQMSIMMMNDGGATRRTAQMGAPAGAPPLEPLTDWPEVKPPFRPGFESVLARPNGELWVRRTEAASAKGTLYDVFNTAGALAYQVRIQEGWTLVGFGNGTVYTTRKDEDDLVYLQRHSF